MKIWAKTEEFKEGKFLVVRRDGTVPHWPHFVLGARDPIAAKALRAYANIYRIQAIESGSNWDRAYAESIEELADDFDRYRAEHGTSDPEAPPHRKDDPDVIDAMRGVGGAIFVQCDKGNTPKK
jgi:hypothetical protein